MAGLSDDDLVSFPSFPAGINNKSQPTEGPMNEAGQHTSLLEAVNVSLSAQGKPFRRPGRRQLFPQPSHSLFSGPQHLFAVVDGVLGAYSADEAGLTREASIATPGERFVTYATDDFSTWWSDGVASGRVDEALVAHPFWVDTPDPVTLAATAAGGLARGRYEVSVVAVDAEGRESGASGPVGLQLEAGQGITLTLPAPPPGIWRWRVYATPPNGEVFYQVSELPATATTAAIGQHAAGARLETLWLHPLPACSTLRFGHGRLFGLFNNSLVWSQEYRLGLMHPDNHIYLGAQALLEPVGDGGAGAGCWVADHKRTYFLEGADPEGWRQIARYPHSAVPGTGRLVPGSLFKQSADMVAYWQASNGTFCIGLPGGELIPLREDSLALPVDAERGATGLMLLDGVKQILTTTISASANLAAVSDSAEATVRRRTA